ncbi:MAG TPA: 23S rRNA (adenine(2503)-C(2))-methyltransferase RlmN [Candidatus Omnitrophota bacterium]|nr:23S rRNA (adenine(2503)-C(2))-methyltransferase RlmN [Candidatus Omnitrophota bacterium]
MIEDIRNLDLSELELSFKALGLEVYRARQVFDWLYKKGVEDFSLMKNLGDKTREKLTEYYSLEPLKIGTIETSRDLTQKFLFCLKDGNYIESVSIPFKSRMTLCLSTQVGCRFCCSFCASGASGFKRNLEVSEIIAQFIAMRKNVPEGSVSNVVFMGVGEPLDNYENVLKAIRIMNAQEGIRLGIRKITISTSGLAPSIERLAKDDLGLELSVSLHAAIDEKRSQIMPVNKKYPIKILFKAIKNFMEKTKRKVTLEYALIGGFNTGVEDAEQLVRLARGMKVNLIPYNPAESRYRFEAPSKLEVLFFKNYLSKKGIDVTVRMPRGTDITAACGQLRINADKKKGAA